MSDGDKLRPRAPPRAAGEGPGKGGDRGSFEGGGESPGKLDSGLKLDADRVFKMPHPLCSPPPRLPTFSTPSSAEVKLDADHRGRDCHPGESFDCAASTSLSLSPAIGSD